MAWVVQIQGYDLSVPSVTNFALYSNAFQNTAWLKTNTTLTDNAHTDPFGGTTASDYARTASGICTMFQQIVIPDGTVGRTFTFSLWIKANTFVGNVLLSVQDAFGGSLQDLTVTPTASWVRYAVTVTCGAGASGTINAVLHATTTGSAGESLMIYGAQLEMAPSANAYVATTGSAATLAPGTSTRVYAMGAGIAFNDAPYAPSAFLSWQSANQKVDTAAAGGVTLQADVGQLDLQNLPDNVTGAGPLDFLTGWAFPNTRANLYWIPAKNWSGRVLMDSATLTQPVMTIASSENATSTLAFPLADPRATLSVPLQPKKYLGNNTGGLGVEGEADITGMPKPILYGVVSNIPGVRVNASLLIYQYSDTTAQVLCVRDGGLALTRGTQRMSLSDLQTLVPHPGWFDYYIGTEGSFIKLGTTPIFRIGIDAQEGPSSTTRTNLLLWSEDPTQSPWTTINATLTAGATASPDRQMNGCMIARNATGSAGIQQNQTVASPVGVTYTLSVFLKGGTHVGPVQIRLTDSNNNNNFTLAVNLTSEWQRVQISGTFTAGAGLTLRNSIVATTGIGIVGDTFYAWGAQLELGAVATQYINTTTVAVTFPDMAQRTHARLWKRFRQERCGTLPAFTDDASITAVDAQDNNEVGFWWAAETTQLDAMNEILTSLSGYEVQNFDYTWSLYKLQRPVGPTAIDFVLLTPTTQETAKTRAIRNLTLAWPGFAPNGIPPYLVNVQWGRNYTTYTEADFAGAAPQRLRDKFSLAFRVAPAQNNSVWNPATGIGPWSQAPILTVQTSYQPGADGLTCLHANMEAQRLLDLYSFGTQQFQLDFTPEIGDQVEVGAVVSVTHPQAALQSGPLFVVLQSALAVSASDMIPKATIVIGFQT